MFDIEKIKSTIIIALEGLYNANYPEVKESIEKYLTALNERLASVSASSLTGQIDADFFAARMKDELLLLESQLISLKILGADVVQDAIKNAIYEALKIITPTLPNELK